MTKPQKTQLDFDKYRTPKLISTIADIVSIPGAIGSIRKWVVIGVGGLILFVVFWLKVTDSMTLFWWAAFEAYSVPAGALAGLAIGVAEFIRRSLNNMTQLIDLMLETTMQVAVDAQGLTSGETEMPPTRDLVEDVYEQVILEITKEVLDSMFGFLAKPIYGLYHVTLNQLVRITIKLIPGTTEVTPELTEKIEMASRLTDDQGRVIRSLRWTQQKLAGIGGWIKLLVILPCYSIVFVIIGLIVLPLGLAWWLFVSG